MSKRLLAILVLMLIPFTAQAEEAPATEAAPAPVETVVPTPNPASGLGPQTSTGAGGSNADASALQPAGGSPLQSTTADSTGLTAPSSNMLQAPATDDAMLKVVMDDLENRPESSSNESATSNWSWLGFSVLFGLIAASAYTVFRDRRRFRRD